jgi:hypothetical protein
MRRYLVGYLLIVIGMVALAGTASAQLGVGAKIPSAEIFVALVSDHTILEGGVSLLGLAGGAVSLVADAKLLLGQAAGLPLTPFIGAGLTISLVGQALFFSPHALAGVEYHLADTPFNLFGELGVSLTFGVLGIGLVPGGQIGVRLDF